MSGARWHRVRAGAPRRERVRGVVARHADDPLGGRVVRLHLVVVDRPVDDVGVLDRPELAPRAEVLLAEAGVAFHDNRLNTWILDTANGKLTAVGDKNIYGGFSSTSYDVSWSPDSKWLAYTRSLPNHLHAIFLYSMETGKSTQVTSEMGESTNPAFDREGKYLYFIASTNAGATSDGLDMTSDLYQVTSNIYAIALAADHGLAPRA